jgi:hypothetical protein
MKKTRFTLLWGLLVYAAAVLLSPAAAHAQSTDTTKAATDGRGYHIDKPGTITFTVGIKIKGKVEKPQVMMFLPKEKPVYAKATFSYSFSEDIMKPLSFEPVEK